MGDGSRNSVTETPGGVFGGGGGRVGLSVSSPRGEPVKGTMGT